MAKKKPPGPLATIEEIERSIHVIRGQRVMLDSDLARLYGVATHRLIPYPANSDTFSKV